MKKTEKLNVLVKQLEELDNSMSESRAKTESLLDLMELENFNVMKQSIEDDSDIEEVKEELKGIQKITRGIGQRFFNLFKVTFCVEFAGVKLIYFTIPKITNDNKE